LLYDGIERPNGLALSPNENILYVDDSYTGHIYAFDVTKDGLLENVRLFSEVGKYGGKGAADGMKVDIQGNVFCTGPGGISVFNPSGERYGIINCPEIPANIGWGDNDLKTLYITARTSIYRMRVKTGGLNLVPNFIPEQIL
jgi:sugar lactone lactonase YvrE